MKKIPLIYFLVLLVLSCQSENTEKALIDDFSIDIPLVNDVNDLFGSPERVIQLDTIREALIGRIGKIIKHENHFYILSDEQRISHFDNEGKFVSSLDKRGGGPGEYTRIGDFNLFVINGNTELWICDTKEIRKYAPSGNSWDFTGTIDFDFVIHKFKIISDKYILFVTGQNEESLLLTDITGAPLQKYLKSEFPFLLFYPVQFMNYDSCVIFKLGASNEGIALDTKDLSFKHIHIVKNNRFLTSKNLLDMYSRLGIDYLGELSNSNNIRGFRNTKGIIWLNYTFQGENFVAARQQGVWKRIKYDRGNNAIMTSIIFSESSDSIILFEYPEDDTLNLILHEYQ
jgi:hypothetical protein